jgi:hypothetical protein
MIPLSLASCRLVLNKGVEQHKSIIVSIVSPTSMATGSCS